MRMRVPCAALYPGLRSWVPLLVAAMLVTGGFGTVQAQDAALPDIRASLAADRSELSVGDPVALALKVIHPEDHAVVVPRLGPSWGDFEVRRQTTATVVHNGDGTRTTSQQIEVTLFAPGIFETPDLPLSVRQPDGSVERVSPTPVTLTVVSVLSGNDETLRDIRAPADFATPVWEEPSFRVLSAMVAGAVVLGAVGLVFYRRARGNHETPVQSVQYREPWEVASEELDRIAALDLPESGRMKDHYALVSRALRAYLQLAHLQDAGAMGAVDMTTDEISSALRSSPGEL